MSSTIKSRKFIENESYIIRFTPRVEDRSIPSLKGSELDDDPVIHIESATAFEDYAEDIRHSKFCRESVGDKYVDYYLENGSFILCMYVYDRRLRERLAGFLSAKIRASGTLYVGFICSNSTQYSGIGTVLMNYLEKIKSAFNLKRIMLNSVPEAVAFYEKLGFTKKKKEINLNKYNLPDNVDPKYYVTHRMTKKSGGGRGRGRSRRRDQ